VYLAPREIRVNLHSLEFTRRDKRENKVKNQLLHIIDLTNYCHSGRDGMRGNPGPQGAPGASGIPGSKGDFGPMVCLHIFL
jgi:hypothetical protein